jgi:hypothetical protein
MDHDYELASYDRTQHHIHDKDKLSKPVSYWKKIAPTTALEEALERGGWEHPDVIKAMKKAGQTAATPIAAELPLTAGQLWGAPVVEEAVEAPAPVAEPAPAPAAEPAPKPAPPAAEKPAGGGKPKFDKQAMLAKIRDRKANK